MQGWWTWRCFSCKDDRREGFGIEQQDSANVPTTPILAVTKVEARRRLWRFGLIAATVAILLFAAVAAAIVLPPAFTRPGVTLGMDYGIYMDRTRDWLAGNGFYAAQQLAGPYQLDQGIPPALYPPVLLYLTVPFTFLPAVLWWAVPLGIIAIALWHIHPPVETWPALAVLLLYPRTWVMLVYGNPSMWAFAALVAGLAWTWPAPLVAIKVTLGPFALVGVRRRSWWITAGVALALSVPFAAMWPDYVTAISHARNGYGLEYLIGEWPIAAVLVLVAWFRATRRDVPTTVGQGATNRN